MSLANRRKERRMIDDPLWGKIKCVFTETLQDLLNEIEPHDLVHVTHCKDCKFYDGRPCEHVNYWNIEDDFCSHAERKEE